MGKPPGLKPGRFVAGGPTVFGRDLTAAVVRPVDSTPVQMAAALAQHRLLANLRARPGGGELKPEMFGMSESSWRRLRSGEKEATIEDLFALAAAAGLELLDLRPPDGVMLPPGAPVIEAGWAPGLWVQPRFAPAATRLEQIDWLAVAAAAQRTVATGIVSGRAAALVGEALAYELLPGLLAQGLPAAGGTKGAIDVPGLMFHLPQRALVSVAVELAANDDTAVTRGTERVLRLLFASAAADEAVAVLALSADVLSRLTTVARDLDGAVGTTYSVSFTQARHYLADDHYRDLAGVVQARVVEPQVTVVVVSIDKVDAVDD